MLKKILRSTSGFTIVEVVVVSVIVAILAAVAIPVYQGFQNDARQNAVEQLAQTAAAAADGYYRKTGVDPTIQDLNLYCDPAKDSIAIVPPEVVVSMKRFPKNTKSVKYR